MFMAASKMVPQFILVRNPLEMPGEGPTGHPDGWKVETGGNLPPGATEMAGSVQNTPLVMSKLVAFYSDLMGFYSDLMGCTLW